jgi:photosynthetic reaction center cytochrome c subunit
MPRDYLGVKAVAAKSLMSNILRFALPSTLIRCAVLVSFVVVGTAWVQGQPTQKQPMAEEVFKNVQVLRGIPVSEFMQTMGFFSAALSANCITCHGEASASSWENYAVDLPLKQSARKMVVMVNAINQANFGGRRVVTCFTCHRGDPNPRVTPTMADVYTTTVPTIVPDTLVAAFPDERSADQILDRYIQAIGGPQQVAKLTSFAAKGTAQAYAEDPYPVEIFAKAPSQILTITHTDSGDRTTVYDGRSGWVAEPTVFRPVPLLPMIEGELAGARLDAALKFPIGLKQVLNDWRVIPSIRINGNPVHVVQATADAGRTPVNLYFDDKSGLLVRMARYTDTKVGLAASQIDYEDYRDVGGVKLPFRWTASWLDGQTVYELSEVQPNAPIAADRFAKPEAPK